MDPTVYLPAWRRGALEEWHLFLAAASAAQPISVTCISRRGPQLNYGRSGRGDGNPRAGCIDAGGSAS